MKQSLIILKQTSCIYRNNEYNLISLDDIKEQISKTLKIIILDEELYVKVFYLDNFYNNIEKFVEQKIQDFFTQNGELLYDYEKSKKGKSIGIYSIKGGNKIKKLIENVNDLEIVPVQYMIRDNMKKIIKSKKVDYKVITKIDDYFYYLFVKDGLFNANYVSKDLEYIYKQIENTEVNGRIYIDNCIKNDELFEKNFQIIKVDIGEVINEKIFKE